MRQAVVENPNTPPSVLQQLAKSKSISLRRQIANNSATTPKVFLNTIEDEDDTVLNLIPLNPNATAPVLKELIQYCDFHNFKFILSPPNCTLEVKKRALNSWADKKSKINTNSIQIDKNYILFRLAVFFSPHAEPAVLASNARSIFWIERYAIAINPNTPQSIREILSRDSNVIVRNAN